MSNLTILNTSVRQINNLFSLNDLHAISGSEDKHRPTFFVRLDTTQELVEEIQKEDPSKPVIEPFANSERLNWTRVNHRLTA